LFFDVTKPNFICVHSIYCIEVIFENIKTMKVYITAFSAVTIFSNDIKIAILDQNRKKIESSILPSQSHDFHESKKV